MGRVRQRRTDFPVVWLMSDGTIWCIEDSSKPLYTRPFSLMSSAPFRLDYFRSLNITVKQIMNMPDCTYFITMENDVLCDSPPTGWKDLCPKPLHNIWKQRFTPPEGVTIYDFHCLGFRDHYLLCQTNEGIFQVSGDQMVKVEAFANAPQLKRVYTGSSGIMIQFVNDEIWFSFSHSLSDCKRIPFFSKNNMSIRSIATGIYFYYFLTNEGLYRIESDFPEEEMEGEDVNTDTLLITPVRVNIGSDDSYVIKISGENSILIWKESGIFTCKWIEVEDEENPIEKVEKWDFFNDKKVLDIKAFAFTYWVLCEEGVYAWNFQQKFLPDFFNGQETSQTENPTLIPFFNTKFYPADFFPLFSENSRRLLKRARVSAD